MFETVMDVLWTSSSIVGIHICCHDCNVEKATKIETYVPSVSTDVLKNKPNCHNRKMNNRPNAVRQK